MLLKPKLAVKFCNGWVTVEPVCCCFILGGLYTSIYEELRSVTNLTCFKFGLIMCLLLLEFIFLLFFMFMNLCFCYTYFLPFLGDWSLCGRYILIIFCLQLIQCQCSMSCAVYLSLFMLPTGGLQLVFTFSFTTVSKAIADFMS